MKNWLLQIVALVVGIWGLAQGRSLSPQVQDSLHAIHPRLRAHWLKERGIDAPGYTKPFQPDSLNMRCVGRWSYGPSYDVTGRITDHDTTVFLARGSGVSVLRFHGGSQPSVTLLSDINAMGLVRRVVMQDSWLFVGTSGIEIYNVSQPTNPVKVSWINTVTSDLAIGDSFLYSVNSESLSVFNIASKANPYRVGAVADSGDAIAVAGGKAYLPWGTFGWHGMYILDVSNPIAPHRAGVWGSGVDAVAARGNLCYISGYDARFHILNVTNPGAPQELSSVGVSGQIYLKGNFAYLTNFAVVDIMDSMMPGIVGTCTIPSGSGIWATGDYGYSFFSCYECGLGIVDFRDPVHPRMDSVGILGHDASRDIWVEGNHAFVAQDRNGLKVLSVADPARPCEVMSYDTVGQGPMAEAVRAAGNLVYLSWQGWDGWRGLYVISAADSADPVLLGKAATFNPIEAVALRDSWLYVAEEVRFQSINIRDSLNPVVVGTCTLAASTGGVTWDVSLNDSIAYVANQVSGLRIINVAQPRNPTPLGWYAAPSAVWSAAVRDTIAYVGTQYDMRIVNVRNPALPVEIGSFATSGRVLSMVLRGNRLLTSSQFTMLDISNPIDPRVVAFYGPGLSTKRLIWGDSLIYACCFEGGVMILKYTGSGGCEESRPVRGPAPLALAISPNPTSGKCRVSEAGAPAVPGILQLFDASGRLVERFGIRDVRSAAIDLGSLNAGVYFVSVRTKNEEVQSKVMLAR